MRYYVCLAGFSVEVVREIQSRSAVEFTEEKGNAPIARPIVEPFNYRHGMSDAYIYEIGRRLEGLTARDEAAVVLCYVNYGGDATKRFLERFFPFAIAMPVAPMYINTIPKHERRKTIVAFVDTVKEACKIGRAKSRVVKDSFSGQNFTPLLLPLRNFKSDVLTPTIVSLFDKLPIAEDARKLIDDARQSILLQHPLRREPSRSERLPYFTDDRELMFRSPGRNRHGMARDLSKGHNPSCLINGRVRLGGAFDALFHYDCEYSSGGVDRQYPNCHGLPTEPAQSTHVNIAPSDAIR